MTDIEDADGLLADGEDDPALVFPLAALAVEHLVDFLRELVALGGNGSRKGHDPLVAILTDAHILIARLIKRMTNVVGHIG